MDADRFSSLVAAAGIDRWRSKDWPASGGISSRAAAHQYRVTFAFLREALGEGSPKDVLDWGSGSAAFSYALATEGHRVFATDFAVPPMRGFIEEQCPGRFEFTRCSDPVTLPYPECSFDVVLSNGTLEHVGESSGSDLGSLREIHRVLRPGGTFVCCHLPSRYSYIEAAVRAVRRPGLYHHPITYTRDGIEAKAESTGLVVTAFRRYGALPRNPLSALPSALRDSSAFVAAYDAVDDALSALLGPLCQNIAFLAVRPGA